MRYSNFMEIGIDIVEIKRIKRLVENNKKFLYKIFTPQELNTYLPRKNKYHHLAARFAAKESLMKAGGRKFSFKEIEILNTPSGKPKVKLYGKTKSLFAKKRVSLSLSHSQNYAIAIAMVKKD